MSKTSRRAVLAGIAAAPAVSLPALASEPDPIHAAIQRLETAWDRWKAATAAYSSAEASRADWPQIAVPIDSADLGPAETWLLTVRQEGQPDRITEIASDRSKIHYVRTFEDIGRNFPRADQEAVRERYRAALEAQIEAREAVKCACGVPEAEAADEAACNEFSAALRELVATEPTTMDGLRAVLAFMVRSLERDADIFEEDLPDFVATISSAAQRIEDERS